MSVFVVSAGKYTFKNKHKKEDVELIKVFLDKKSAKEYAKELVNKDENGVSIAEWYKIHNLTKQMKVIENEISCNRT